MQGNKSQTPKLFEAWHAAVKIEPRQLHELERWLTADRPEPHTKEWRRRWNIGVMRILKLSLSNPKLGPHVPGSIDYLRALYGMEISR